MRIIRRVISPRLAMRILLNGGACCLSADDNAENVRLEEHVDIVSMVRGSAARYNCCADERNRNAAVRVRAAPPFLQAVLRNKEDDIILLVNYYYWCNDNEHMICAS